MLMVLSLAATTLLGQSGAPQERRITVTAPQTTVEHREPHLSQRVSARFNRALLPEVLEWLSKQDVSYVVADADLSKDQTLTLNINDQPLSDVVEAIAAALGGHWQRRGAVRAFTKGHGMTMFGAQGMAHMPNMKDFEKLETFGKMKGFEKMKDFDFHFEELPGEDFKFRSDMTSPEGRKMMTRNLELAMPKIREKIEGLRTDLPKIRAKIRREGPEGKMIEEEIERALTEAEGGLRRAEIELHALPKGEHMFIVPGEKRIKELRTLAPKVLRTPGTSIGVVEGDASKLFASLTAAQKEKQKSQGFISASDLTPQQRKMLGIGSQMGKWTIKLVHNGQELTVKSE